MAQPYPNLNSASPGHIQNQPASASVNSASEPVIYLSQEDYEDRLFLLDVRKKVDAALEEVREGKELDAFEVMEALRVKYGL